jgi:hypothetical protein
MSSFSNLARKIAVPHAAAMQILVIGKDAHKAS